MPFPRFYSACLLALGFAPITATLAGPEGAQVEPIKPPEQKSDIRRAAIDTERFELGAFAGFLSVEDFDTNAVAGISASYHISSRFIAQLNYGLASVDRATFEDVSGGNFLSDDDRDFEYQSLLVGYELMQGRSFLGERRKFNSHLYLLAGPNQVSFAGEDNTGLSLGIHYKMVATDWLTLNLDFQDIIVDREFLGTDKTTHNTQMTLGVSALF